ncbi:MAG: DNA topoisomerase 3 [Thermodesulfobacteriota bacterium]
MKTLILTEKPSVARDFAKALGVKTRHDGYMADGDTVITWALGHLLELLEPQDYDPRWKTWRLNALPILPERFRYKPISKTRKQLRIVKKLLKSPLERVVIATDAGREGEVIARTILLDARVPEGDRLLRFWTSQALTPEVVRKGMENLAPAARYDRLWRAGQARQIADWLVGMNGTRAATKQMDDLYSVGRVQTALLALIVDRRREREHFRPEPYWLLRALFSNEKGTWRGTWFQKERTRFDKEPEATAIRAKVDGAVGKIQSVKKQKKRQPPPFLYSLTDLQRDANQKYGLTAKATLGIAQKLYEQKKCLSYPRTDSRVLGTQTVDLARNLVGTLSGVYSDIFGGVVSELIAPTNKRVFNDARLTDHHALIPLAPLPGAASADEKKIYDLVLKRFAAAFHPDCEFEQTEIITEAEKETFRTKGKRILTPGWRAVYGTESTGDSDAPKSGDDEPESESLPPLAQGDPARVDEAQLEKKMTQPPPDYNDARLLKDMTNPGRYVQEDELKKIYRGDVGLGTQATRAQIIETLLTRKYIVRKKKFLIATDKGCRLIETLRGFKEASVLASPEETARWEMNLERIAHGDGSEEIFLEEIKQLVRKIVDEFKNGPQAAPQKAAPQKSEASKKKQEQDLGTCPACGGKIIEGKRGFGCGNWRETDGGCRFVIWKTVAGKTLSPEMIKELTEKREIGPLDGFMSKKGKPFSAKLRVVQEEDGSWRTVFEFGDPPSNAEALGKCPACGGNVVEGNKGYGCVNWKQEDGGCKFVIWKTVAQKEIPQQTAKKLLEQGATEELFGFISRKGSSFSARLKLEDQGDGVPKVVFDFDRRS